MKKITILLSLLLFCLGLLGNGVLIKNGVNGQYLRLKACNVETVINNQVATSTASMRFINNFSSATNTVFAFPHPAEASPTGLRWFVNGAWHNAVIAPGAGGSVVPPGSSMYPALENYLTKTHLAFPVSEQVSPGQEMIFEVTYVELLPYSNGTVDYGFRSGYGYLINNSLDSLSVNIQITGNRTITDVQLPGFPNPAISINGNSASVQMTQQNYDLQADIRLSYNLALDNLGANTFSTMINHQYVPDTLGDGFFMSIVEPEPSAEVIQKYFTFMMDRSSVMSDANMQQARQAASYMIENLNVGDYFNIVDFATVAGTFAVNHVPFNPQNRDLALSYIANLEPGGSCNISGAFDTAIPQFAGAPNEAAHVIVFLTIGHPTTGIVNSSDLVDHIDSLVSATDRDVNIFCFGLGTNIDFQLLSIISAAHQGMATYVGLDQLLDVLTDFYTKIRNPILLDPLLELVGELTNITEIYPNPLPNLYLGNQMIICGRYFYPTNLVYNISGFVLGDNVNYHYEHILNPVPNPDLQFVMKIWAKLKIEHLMALYYQLNPNSTAAMALHDQIVEISIAYGVLCSFTSFTGGEVSNSDETVPPVLKPFNITSSSPNPFHSRVDLRVKVNAVRAETLILKIFNARGQLIKTLSLRADRQGEYSFSWDGRDESGSLVASGVYFCNVSIPGFCQSSKVLLIR